MLLPAVFLSALGLTCLGLSLPNAGEPPVAAGAGRLEWPTPMTSAANDPVLELVRRSPKPSFLVSIFLDRMSWEERSRNQALLEREFQSLSHFVPGTVLIESNTLYWMSTLTPMEQGRHKSEAIAILRRNNIRLSAFSEQWLKDQAKFRGTMPVPRPSGHWPGT